MPFLLSDLNSSNSDKFAQYKMHMSINFIFGDDVSERQFIFLVYGTQ